MRRTAREHFCACSNFFNFLQQFLQFFASISSTRLLSHKQRWLLLFRVLTFLPKGCLKKQPWLCAQPILRYFPRQRLFVCLKIPLTRVSCKKGIKSSFSQISVFHYGQYWEMIKMLNRRYLMNFHHSGSVQINRWRRGHILPVEEKNHISIEEVEDFLKFLDIPLSFMIS